MLSTFLLSTESHFNLTNFLIKYFKILILRIWDFLLEIFHSELFGTHFRCNFFLAKID